MERTPHWAEHFILLALERAFDKAICGPSYLSHWDNKKRKKKREKNERGKKKKRAESQ